MSGGGCSIVWFRRDLRIEDNPALAAGVRTGPVIPLFIWAPEEEGHYHPGRVSRWWLKQSLAHLDASLRTLGAPILTRRATDSVSCLLEVFRSTGATYLFFNHLYGKLPLPVPTVRFLGLLGFRISWSFSPFRELGLLLFLSADVSFFSSSDPISLVRDHKAKQVLVAHGIEVRSFNADLLYEPWEVKDDNGQSFNTFAPFWSKCLSMPYDPSAPLLPPKRIISGIGRASSCILVIAAVLL